MLANARERAAKAEKAATKKARKLSPPDKAKPASEREKPKPTSERDPHSKPAQKLNKGKTARTLVSAARYNCESRALELLRAKASVNHQDRKGDSALHWASRWGNCNILIALVGAKADLKAQTSNGNTPLHEASWKGNNAILDVLLNGSMIDVNQKNYGGDTALHWAAWRGHGTSVMKLLESKADVKIRDNKGRTAMHMAEKYRQKHVINILHTFQELKTNRLDNLRQEAAFNEKLDTRIKSHSNSHSQIVKSPKGDEVLMGAPGNSSPSKHSIAGQKKRVSTIHTNSCTEQKWGTSTPPEKRGKGIRKNPLEPFLNKKDSIISVAPGMYGDENIHDSANTDLQSLEAPSTPIQFQFHKPFRPLSPIQASPKKVTGIMSQHPGRKVPLREISTQDEEKSRLRRKRGVCSGYGNQKCICS